ncbi:juvenile hormone esterase-like [Colletes latitarsis]|uniref:juvenile hormone esterase-like n=1 Tax=Colletes latitarsis TaxID=2605962 RepID=UPI0040356190
MNVSIPLILTLLTSLCGCLGVIRTPVIETKSGPVQGSVLTTVWNSVKYSSFKGIPFATPPVGNLRFKPPVPPEPWGKTRDAIEEPESCPQLDIFDFHYMGNEDCLYLSVFTPEMNFNRNMTPRVVMVWMYGGSYVSGFIKTSFYGPDFFMEQDVVVVSFNYRLGALGFLNLNHPDALGNAALKDQTMVLRWVQDNIAAFGGDPGQVTIFGESAGSASVIFHTMSKHSRGLFQRVIAQSGAPIFPLYSSPSLSMSNARRLANILGFSSSNTSEILDFLRQLPARDIVEAADTVNVITAIVTLPFVSTKENAQVASRKDIFLHECPITLLESGEFTKHDIMIGFNDSEVITAWLYIPMILNSFAKIWNTLFTALPFYPEDWYGLIDNIIPIGTDFFFKAPIDLTRKLMEQNNDGHPIYFYQISYNSPYLFHKSLNITSEGTGHLDDVGLIFNIEQLNAPTDPQHPFNRFRNKVVTLWTNFAKYGNPTPKGANPLGNVIWEPSGKDGRIFNINDSFSMLNNEDVITERILLIESIMHYVLHYISDCNRILL